ncbi:MAG TPA: MBOAT family O-acyltransferase [Elusimicrobiota bacterium]|nr:MBOAT family O-acyltransferase [Elusimicrobiota bacterium]
MLFNSFEFLIFFPAVTLLYFALPHRFRWALLLAASCLFYMAFIPQYILILFLTIAVDYTAGLYIEKSEGHRRKMFLAVSLVCTAAILFVFKYFNFFNSNFARIAEFFHWNYPIQGLSIILPIGLSFHTFQSMSYVIEVYRGRQRAEKNFGIFALYVMFYPQLVAGPIERPQNLLHQFYEEHRFDYRRVTDGLKLMAWGLFKKVVIADRLAVFVNHVYADPASFPGISLLLATVFFAFQIYCDFSGYSDIAIGSAQVMGFRLMDNFNRPYFSKSVAEFWKRWHISLSSWFRDYLYIPLGGSRVSVPRWYLNLFLTFLISGLWHGANWTYVFWGALNGAYLVSEIVTAGPRRRFVQAVGLDRLPRLHKIVQVSITFSLICFSWIFFRAENLREAFYIVGHIFSGVGPFVKNFTLYLLNVNFKLGLTVDSAVRDQLLMGQTMPEFRRALLAIGFMEIVHLIQRHKNIRHFLSQKPFLARWTVYYLLVISILLWGLFKDEKFIYFQF